MSAATPFCFRGVSSTLQDTIAQITPKSNGVEFAFSEVKGGQGGEAHNTGRFVSVLTRKHKKRERERRERRSCNKKRPEGNGATKNPGGIKSEYAIYFECAALRVLRTGSRGGRGRNLNIEISKAADGMKMVGGGGAGQSQMRMGRLRK